MSFSRAKPMLCGLAVLATAVVHDGTRAQPTAPTAPTAGEVVQLPEPDGAAQRLLYLAPRHPRASLVMLPGGSGDIGIEVDGTLRHDDNFLVRTRPDWVARGFAVLLPDAIDGANLRGQRSSAAYGRLVDSLARFARSRADRPVFLMGTSQGAIAAMNGASAAPPGLLAGVILTESVSVRGGSHETVFDAHPADVRVPALIVANADDRCGVAPPPDAPRIAAALRNAPDVKVVTVRGGIDVDGKPCGSLSPHGYDSIEPQVVQAISIWIDAHL